MKTTDQVDASETIATPSPKSWARTRVVAKYTIALAALSLGAGMASGILRMLLPGETTEHVWGEFDAVVAMKLVMIVIIYGLGFRRLAQRHRANFLSIGAAIAILTGLLNTLLNAFMAPQGTAAISVWVTLLTVILYLTIMLVSGLLLGAIGSRSHVA
jgi:hypothetical protein